MAVFGPDFISLQVSDLNRSATFYEGTLGLTRAAQSPPGAVVFDTTPISFAVRECVPGFDLATVPQPGAGVALWLRSSDAQQLHDALVAAGTHITAPPVDGPFGRTFSFADPDGYVVTIHDAP